MRRIVAWLVPGGAGPDLLYREPPGLVVAHAGGT
jgi:hypothetical protein